MLDCPSIAALARLGTDMIEAETLVALEGHVDVCPRCQERLQRLALADALEMPSAATSLPDPGEAPKIADFVIERELGRGSTGVVYQAIDPSLGRRVALKVVRSGPSAGSHDHARWLREARAFARVRHENVVRLYQVGEAQGWLFLVLELIPGGTLEERLKAPWASRDAAVLLERIARAVIAIHREGLVHLDLKPSNILLDAGPADSPELAVPRVGDFGIAFRSDEPDECLATAVLAGPVGTPSYMAPEQVASDRDQLGPRADVYGLGAILYHLLTGRQPFAASSVIDTLDQVRHQEPVPPRRLDPTVPRDLETICLKCLQKEPGRRYDSAEALADDLRRWIDGRPIAARPASIGRKTWRACRRRPAVAALASALSFSVLIGFVGMLLLWTHAEAQRIRAEHDFRIATEVLDQIVYLSNSGQGSLSRFVVPERLVESLVETRGRIQALSERRAGHPAIARQLIFVDRRLCEALMEQSRWAEARAVLERSVAELDAALLRNPADHHLLRVLSRCFWRFGAVAERQGRIEESIGHLRRAVRLAERGFDRVPGAESILALAQSRESLAVALAQRGDRDESRALMLANAQLFEKNCPNRDNTRIAAWRIGLLADFRRLIEGARGVPWPGSDSSNAYLARLASPEADQLPAHGWAALAVEAIEDLARSGTPPAPPHEIGFHLSQHMASTASELRRLDKLPEARRLVDLLLAFSRLLLDRYPDQPFAHLALAEAYGQLNKNAWKTHDRAAIVRNLELAIAANQQALLLDPNHETARFQLYRRQQKLKGLKIPTDTPGHPGTTAKETVLDSRPAGSKPHRSRRAGSSSHDCRALSLAIRKSIITA